MLGCKNYYHKDKPYLLLLYTLRIKRDYDIATYVCL